MSEVRLRGLAGNIPFDCPAEEPDWMTNMRVKEVVRENNGKIESISYYADCGHYFGETDEIKVIKIHIGEKVSFIHRFVDTEDGVWESDSFTVTAELVEI